MSYVNLKTREPIPKVDTRFKRAACFSGEFKNFLGSKNSVPYSQVTIKIMINNEGMLDNDNDTIAIHYLDALYYLDWLKRQMGPTISIVRYDNDDIRGKAIYVEIDMYGGYGKNDNHFNINENDKNVHSKKYVLAIGMVRNLYEGGFAYATYNAIQAAKNSKDKYDLGYWVGYFMRNQFISDQLHSIFRYGKDPIIFNTSALNVEWDNAAIYCIVHDEMTKLSDKTLASMEKSVESMPIFYNGYDQDGFVTIDKVFYDEED